MTQTSSITGKPRRSQRAVVIGWRVFSDNLMVMILAVEPIGVPLPPKPAPSARAHHSGVMSSPRAPR
jgi:hypothetical protein